MKFLFISPRFSGGIGGHAAMLAEKLSQSGHEGAKELATYWVGQGVGLMNQSMSSGAVVQNFKEEFIEAYERLTNYLS